MASQLIFAGNQTSVPGVYTQIIATALGGQAASVGRLAVVGEFPTFPQAGPQVFSTARNLTAWDPVDDFLKLIGYLAFNPSDDPDANGGAQALYVVSPTGGTQAFAEMLDALATVALKFTSKIYGPRGNRARVEASKTGDVYTFTISREGYTESYEVEPEAIADFLYDSGAGAVLDSAELSWGALTADYVWNYQFGAKPAGASPLEVTAGWDQAPTDTTVDLTISAGAGATHTAAVDVLIEGKDLLGAAQTETVSFPAGDSTPQTSTKSWSSIEKATVSTTDVAWIGIISVAGSKSYETAARSVSAVLTDLNNIPYFDATLAQPGAGSIVSSQTEGLSSQDVFAPAELRADGWFIANELGASALVDVVQVSFKAPDLSSAVALDLVGGTSTTPDADDWQAALDSIVDQDIQIVALLTDSATIARKLPAHCNAAALQGFERNAWAGATGGQTIKQVYDGWSKLLNSPYVTLAADRVVVDHPNGTQPTLEPPYLALMLAGMQAGSDIAEPLTRKRPRIINATQDWAPNRDAKEVINRGICALSYDSVGWRVSRSVTTYLTDDNPILSETSSFESVQTSVRRLRLQLNGQIGQKGFLFTASNIRAQVRAELDRQVADGVIKAYQNISVFDEGDTFRVEYEVAAIEPVNFIPVTAVVVRIAGE